MAAAQAGQQSQPQRLAYTYNSKDGSIRIIKSFPAQNGQPGGTVTFDGHVTKTPQGHEMNGKFTFSQGGRPLYSGDWKQTKRRQ
jgi:hypothetical protein